MMKEPEINVGIVNAQEIHFSLNGRFFAKGETVCGEQSVSFSEGGILWNGNLYRELTFTPQDERTSFSLYDVTIGINFHWERQETQSFMGTLKLVVDEGKITAINILPVEDYLISVISSEMNATSSLEFLKAHAVVSRSWLFAQMEKRKALCNKNEGFFSFVKTENEYIRWYDREDHTIFDVCADDHCQRYQGITKASNATVAEAVRATRGQLLMYGQGICDARFSKCCGGAFEEFQNCWENVRHPYLTGQRDASAIHLPDLTIEKEAEKEAQQIVDIKSIANDLALNIIKANSQLETYLVKNKKKTKKVKYDYKANKPSEEEIIENEEIETMKGIIDRQGLKMLASALKDLNEIIGNDKEANKETLDKLDEVLKGLGGVV